jgi:hypothetical protein
MMKRRGSVCPGQAWPVTDNHAIKSEWFDLAEFLVEGALSRARWVLEV